MNAPTTAAQPACAPTDWSAWPLLLSPSSPAIPPSGSAIMLTILSALCMMWISKLESWLPSRPAIAVTLEFQKNFVPQEHTLREVVSSNGYEVASGSFAIRSSNEKLEWHFVAIALSKSSGVSMNELASGLTTLQGVEDFSLSHARN